MKQTQQGKPSSTNALLNRRGLLLAALTLPIMGERADAQNDTHSSTQLDNDTAPPSHQRGLSSDANPVRRAALHNAQDS